MSAIDLQLIQKKARAIRLLILDVDGILTSGHLYFGEATQGENKGFHVRDGLGIVLLQAAGIPVALLTGHNSQAVAGRLTTLKIQHYYPGLTDKLPAYTALKTSLGLQDEEIACMGDDLPDLPMLRRAGLCATVPGAPAIIKQHVDFITQNDGGTGAVREMCELILNAQEKFESVIKSYLV